MTTRETELEKIFSVKHIYNWNDAVNEVYSDIGLHESWKRFRNPFVFRGVNLVINRLETTLQRTYPAVDVRKLEKILLRNFQKYLRAHPGKFEFDELELLCYAQHHGLPTRLLDWSFSPLVGLYFATRNEKWFSEDGAIWKINMEWLHDNVGVDLFELDTVLARNYSLDIFKNNEINNLSDFDKRFNNSCALILEPPSFDDQIVNQLACFTLMSDPTKDLEESLSSLPDHKENVFVIIIDKDAKRQIADYLHISNITERVLFPGPDGLSITLMRRYGPWRRDVEKKKVE